jgi:hypothetical protein
MGKQYGYELSVGIPNTSGVVVSRDWSIASVVIRSLVEGENNEKVDKKNPARVAL